ncbi:hypothetical protein [Deinococcus hohokamensis]|uniref:Uncharacterized protein n=1 Tax=Deinococcus hohokamensis TaxID=309883 RepID=A0ABV9IBY1_9DEIO
MIDVTNPTQQTELQAGALLPLRLKNGGRHDLSLSSPDRPFPNTRDS